MLSTAEVRIKPPESNFKNFAQFYVTSKISKYNIIFVQIILRQVGISLDLKHIIGWKETKTPMKSINCKMRTNFAVQESKNIKSATNGIKNILDAKYEKANLKEITNKLKYLKKDDHFLIYRLLKKHEKMFDGILGNYTGAEYKFELLEGAQLYHVPVPKIREESL